jgi:hypothetical protein
MSEEKPSYRSAGFSSPVFSSDPYNHLYSEPVAANSDPDRRVSLYNALEKAARHIRIVHQIVGYKRR